MKKSSIVVIGFCLVMFIVLLVMQLTGHLWVKPGTALPRERMVVIDKYYSGRVCYDRETGVEYWFDNAGGAVMLVDEDGKPFIYGGEPDPQADPADPADLEPTKTKVLCAGGGE